jgi:hypothetical protein
MKIELAGGKYTYIFENGKHCALRYGEEWRDLTGDNLIYAMACEIERLQEEIEERDEYAKDMAFELDLAED